MIPASGNDTNGLHAPPTGRPVNQQAQLEALSLRNDELRAQTAHLRLQAAAVSCAGGRESSGLLSRAAVFRNHEDVVSGIGAGGRNTVVTCSWDSRVRVFDLWTWTEEREMSIGGGQVLAAALSLCSPDLVGCACQDGRARLWRDESESPQVLSGHEGSVNDIAFHTQQEMVAGTASDDQKVVIWDVSTGSQVRVMRQHAKGVTGLEFLAASAAYDRSVASACRDGHARLWDLRAPALQCALRVGVDQSFALATHAPSHLAAAATDRCQVVCWDLRTLRTLTVFDLVSWGVEGVPTALAISPCCCFVAVGTSTGAVLCVDLQAQARQTVSQHEDAISSLAWGSSWPYSANAMPYLLCASFDGSWSCWTPSSEGGVQHSADNEVNRWLGAER